MRFDFDPFTAFTDYWRWSAHVQQAWSASLASPEFIARLRRHRLDELLAHAHLHSRFYKRLHGSQHGASAALAELAPVNKSALMANFDQWVCDSRIKLVDIERFIADPQRIGEPYLGHYAVWTSSGSTGRPGIYVQDEEALATYDALLSTRFPSSGADLSPFRTMASGGRFAMIAALGGHFAGVVSWERLRREFPWMRELARSFSVLAPIRELAAQIDDFAPAVIASYPTTLLLLAREREAGRLRVTPRALWSGGETLAIAEREEISRAFGCPVIDGYGASECLNIAYDCGHGALHLNSDWVILEPIDANGRKVEPGELSASVLLTNLANRVQPLIRYDLGDSIRFATHPCRCGSPFPAIEVQGRRDDIICFNNDAGEPVSMPPLALATVVEEGARVHRFQLTQSSTRTIRVRFETPSGDDRGACWARIESSLRAYLLEQGLRRIQILRDDAPVQADPVSGKLREVMGLTATRNSARAGKRTLRKRAARRGPATEE